MLDKLLPGVKLLDLFPEAKVTIGSALNAEQQLFVSANLKTFLKFLQTPSGRESVQKMVDAWMESAKEKAP